jgi:hypothetical protein
MGFTLFLAILVVELTWWFVELDLDDGELDMGKLNSEELIEDELDSELGGGLGGQLYYVNRMSRRNNMTKNYEQWVESLNPMRIPKRT